MNGMAKHNETSSEQMKTRKKKQRIQRIYDEMQRCEVENVYVRILSTTFDTKMQNE